MSFQKSEENYRKESNITKQLTSVLFTIYLMALCWILLFKLGVRFSYMGNRSVNLIPFREAINTHGRADLSETVMNIVIFVPLGIYAGALFKSWSFKKTLFLFFLTSLSFESLQFILKIGAFDITDIITNTSGGIIGSMIFNGLEKAFKNSLKTQKFINIIATIGTIAMLLLLVLLKTNNLGIKYR